VSLHPLTAKVIDDLAASMQAAAERMEEMKKRIAELEHQLLLSRPLRLRYDAENAVLEASRALPESTLAFWRATRHIQGFDPAIEFIDAVVALRALEEEGDR
jgi:hypothetical protein